MKYPYLIRIAAVAAAMGAGATLAQTQPSAAPVGPPPAVVTDVGPPPAEERSSTGAIVLEDSLVRAQRENGFQRSAAKTGVATVGRGVLRSTLKAQAEAATARAREEQMLDLHRMGAGSQTVP